MRAPQAREKRPVIESTFRQHFVEFFNRKVRGEAPTPARPRSGELSLVADEDLEETLAVSEMSRKLSNACEGELFALSQRMGFLLERPELEDDANPLSPATICAALKDACDQIEAGFKVRMALLRQFEELRRGDLQRVYHDLNAHLVAAPASCPTSRADARGAPPASARGAPGAAGSASRRRPTPTLRHARPALGRRESVPSVGSPQGA